MSVASCRNPLPAYPALKAGALRWFLCLRTAWASHHALHMLPRCCRLGF